MSIIRISRTVDDLQSLLSQTLKQMEEFTRNQNYAEAQQYRLKSEQLKKDLSIRRVYQMERRQQGQLQDLSNTTAHQMNRFTAFWIRQMEEYYLGGNKLTKQMRSRHETEVVNLRKELEDQLPFRVKESSECLNLRKMEQHMVKQKKFAEAHIIQTQVSEMEKSERQKWLKNRNQKIDKAVSTLLAKQQVQLNALTKKIKTGQDQQEKDKTKEEKRINLKYGNTLRELKMKHQKQLLALKGHFTSKGGEGSPLLTKTMLFNSRE